VGQTGSPFFLRTVARLSDNIDVVNKFKDFLARLKPSRQADEDAPSWRDKVAGGMSSVRSALAARMRRGGGEGGAAWARRIDWFVSKESFTTHHRVFLAAFILGTTYSVAKIAALLLRGRPSYEAPAIAREAFDPGADFNPMSLGQLRTADPFKTSGGGSKVADTRCDSAEAATSLPLKLVNTVVLQDSVKSIAAVQVRSGRELKEVREGDVLDGLAKIFHITRLELIIKNLETGACELVAGSQPRGGMPIQIMNASDASAFRAQKKIKGIENVGNKFTISRELLDEKLKDISVVLTQARATKIQNPDGTIAFKLSEIEPAGIFAYLGIQDGDIINSINGKPITDINEVMSHFGRIKNMDNMQLGIRREGDDSQLDYSIKK
jgi:type II secretion system protein C